MRILVTNDDGYDAAGLVAIAAALVAAGHEVTVAAPTSDRSGSGSALGSIEDGTLIGFDALTLPALGPSVPVYALDCPPALAVLASCSGSFGPAPELVVSGVNPGHNTGRSILFSSTVGAVLAAQVAGIGGLAISCGFAPHHRFDTAARVGDELVDWMITAGATGLTLNVNVPDTDYAQLRGVQVTTLGRGSMFSLHTSRHEAAVELHRRERHSGFRSGTDGAAVVNGYVSVTALSGIAGVAEPLLAPDADEPISQFLSPPNPRIRRPRPVPVER